VSSVFVIEDKKDIHKQINFFRKRLYENISIPEIKLKKDLLIEIIEYFKRKVGSKYSKQP
jgi:hypothetical protein